MATNKLSFYLILIIFFSFQELGLSCIEKERNALTKFKQSLQDLSGWLSTWVDEDCCTWTGVTCSSSTGNVVKLDLKTSDYCHASEESSLKCLKGELNSSLIDLQYLKYLDLSGNDFQGSVIPTFLGSLKNLVFLDISLAAFTGMVPPSLGNLSKLRHLDLTSYPYDVDSLLWTSDLKWLSGLPSLQILGLGGVDISRTGANWLHAVKHLPFLQELYLFDCKLEKIPQHLAFINFTSLQVLDLSGNRFNSSIPRWIFNISTLVDLDLRTSRLKGHIPGIQIGSLCHLQKLHLSDNYFTGNITGLIDSLSGCTNNKLEVLDLSGNNFIANLPYGLGYLVNMKTLRLSKNFFSGPIPISIGNLSGLEELDLDDNEWGGYVSETHFQELKNLKSFSISTMAKSLALKIAKDWVPTFSLQYIRISNCNIGPRFPGWLRTQKEVTEITITNASISDIIPNWFWKLSPQIRFLDLSRNQLRGRLPGVLNFGSSAALSLDFNQLEGEFPLWSNVSMLSIINNLLSGPIPSNISDLMPELTVLHLSGNSFSGRIPSSLGDMEELTLLDLSNNHLSGELISFRKPMQKVKAIDLSHNHLSGRIPGTICSLLPSLQFLKLSSNNISGELPRTLENCTNLILLDTGENRISGSIPPLMGEKLSNLEALLVQGNILTGRIPRQLCNFPSLHIIDLSGNKLSGNIPSCVGNLSGFNHYRFYYQDQHPHALGPSHSYSVELVFKGRRMQYSDMIPLVNLIDLSRNCLEGSIPNGITDITTLVSLNLSWNQLSGSIPDNIGAFQSLETLDLSCNHICGPIPESMSSLTMLNHLNLSYNNLSGPIPTSNQFQTFNDASIYEGNPKLCGLPLATKCSKRRNDANDSNIEDENKSDELWFAVSMVLGFAVAFCGVCGSSMLRKSCIAVYFRILQKIKDGFLLLLFVKEASFRRLTKIRSEGTRKKSIDRFLHTDENTGF